MSLKSSFRHLFHPQRSNNHRPALLHPQALFSLALIALGFVGLLGQLTTRSATVGYVLGFSSSITPAQVIEQTNQERLKLGLVPLTLNSKLTQAAVAKGQDMFAQQYWAHISPTGTEPWAFITNAGYSYRVAGENLARDFLTTGDMVSAWMKSPTHRANIVNSRYQEIGIGVIDGVLEGHETTLVVQMFGSPLGGASEAQVSGANTYSQVAQASENSAKSGQAATSEVNQANILQLPAQLAQASPLPVVVEAQQLNFSQPAILAGALVPQGELKLPPLFSLLQITKAFFLGLIMMIMLTLAYDGLVIGHRETARVVGKNLAHIIFLIGVSFLLILFKGGIVG